MRIRILLLIKVFRICDHWWQTLKGSILSLNAFIVSVHGPSWLLFEPLKLLYFDFSADPDSDTAFYTNADPDPASKTSLT